MKIHDHRHWRSHKSSSHKVQNSRRRTYDLKLVRCWRSLPLRFAYYLTLNHSERDYTRHAFAPKREAVLLTSWRLSSNLNCLRAKTKARETSVRTNVYRNHTHDRQTSTEDRCMRATASYIGSSSRLKCARLLTNPVARFRRVADRWRRSITPASFLCWPRAGIKARDTTAVRT